MYKYFPLLFYVTTVLCLKRCQEQSRLYFLIDSTNTTTSRDFGVQIDIVRYILNEYKSFKLTLSVQVYHNDQCLNNTDFPSLGFHDLSDPKVIKRRLNSLQHVSTNYTFDKQCALQMLPNSLIFDSNENRYSIILAKYESLKNIIDQKEHVKFRQGGSYILALMYNSTKNEKGVFARRVPNIADMIPAIMKYACPSYAPASTSYEKIAPTSTRYEKIVSRSTASGKIAPTSATYKKIISRSTAYKKTASASTMFRKVALLSTTLEKIAPTSTSLENFAPTLTTHKKIIVSGPSSKNQISTTSILRSVLLHGTVSRKVKSDFTEVCSTPSLSHLPSNVDVKSSVPLESIVYKSDVVTKSRNKETFSTTTPIELQSQKYNTLFSSGVSSFSASRYVATSKVYSERSLSSLLTSVEYTSSTIKVIPTKSSYMLQAPSTSIKHKSNYAKVDCESSKISPTMSTLKQYFDSSSYRTSLSTPFFLPSSYIKTSLPATSNKHSVSSDKKTLIMTQSTTLISPSLVQYNTTIREIQSTLGSSFMSSSNVVFKTVFRQCTTVNKAEKSSIITLPSITGTLPVYFSTLSRVSPSVLYPTDVISFTNKAGASAMRRSNNRVETTMLKETVSRLLTRSSMFPTQQVVPSSSNKLAYSSKAVVLPAWKRLSKEIDDFIQQNLTDSQLKSEEWTKEFINQSSKFFDNISFIKEYRTIKQISVNLVEYIEEVFLKVGKHLPSGGIIKRTEENLDVEISAIDTKRFNGYSFENGQGKNEIVLPKTIFQNFSSDKAVIVGMIFRTPRSFESFDDHFEPAEDIISLSVEPSVEYNLVENPLSYQLQVKENNFSGYKCVFWNNSDWDEYGCRVSHVNGTSVTCNCNP
ncbi:mucin-5AC-like [Hydractinia symbiolongicarpus]|uniref:mucin-5AC-like n=1 Tax=Hydractinia symbiolongicarpus TaxID=13093 RepID=UPI00254D1C7E|nr:mucin-5AC-like [Hydractinia symbiolongicarpus]